MSHIRAHKINLLHLRVTVHFVCVCRLLALSSAALRTRVSFMHGIINCCVSPFNSSVYAETRDKQK